MRRCIAIDSGGTKTEVILFDETGHILRRCLGAGGNATDIGIPEARRRLARCLDEVLSGTSPELEALYGGVAGVIQAGDVYTGHFHALYPKIKAMRFEDDGFSIISGTLGHSDGCGMVCGTGSSLFVRIDGQPYRHIGGKGYLIDTGGSGFELGQSAIKMAMRAVDGRCHHTVLVELLEKILGEPVSDRVIYKVHQGGRAYIASFAAAVFEGRKMGDKICCEIFTRQAALLADLTYPAAELFDGSFTVVAGGGIAANFPEYLDEIQRLAAPGAKIVLQQAPPVYGAAVEAMWHGGIGISDEFKSRFLSDYAALTARAD